MDAYDSNLLVTYIIEMASHLDQVLTGQSSLKDFSPVLFPGGLLRHLDESCPLLLSVAAWRANRDKRYYSCAYSNWETLVKLRLSLHGEHQKQVS